MQNRRRDNAAAERESAIACEYPSQGRETRMRGVVVGGRHGARSGAFRRLLG